MRRCEIELLNQINSFNRDRYNRKKSAKVDVGFQKLQMEKLGMVSKDFLNHPVVMEYILFDDLLIMWHFIQVNSCEMIEKRILEITSNYNKTLTDKGIGIPPKALFSPILIRSVYLSGRPELINIFQRYLPFPKINIFIGYDIPDVIYQHQFQISAIIQDFLGSRLIYLMMRLLITS